MHELIPSCPLKLNKKTLCTRRTEEPVDDVPCSLQVGEGELVELAPALGTGIRC